MPRISIHTSLVSVKWLYKNLGVSNLVVLDATIKKVKDNQGVFDSETQIPSTRFFDIKHTFSDTSAEFPNTFPTKEQFTIEAQKLGINNDSAIVVYDDKGIYSSARVWMLFKAFGHNNIAVLDGGFPEWKKANYKVEKKQDYNGSIGDFVAALQPQYFKFFDDIIKISNDKSYTILDARSEQRFKGLVAEPRTGLRSGTIPNSINLSYTKLLNGNCLKSKTELFTIFNTLVKPDQHLIFSCGSGITACILALGAEISDYKNSSVYDGSWTEYGSLIVI
jgi:thiosulfate/3-mercaptopyruvate sulfurtransferase